MKLTFLASLIIVALPQMSLAGQHSSSTQSSLMMFDEYVPDAPQVLTFKQDLVLLSDESPITKPGQCVSCSMTGISFDKDGQAQTPIRNGQSCSLVVRGVPGDITFKAGSEVKATLEIDDEFDTPYVEIKSDELRDTAERMERAFNQWHGGAAYRVIVRAGPTVKSVEDCVAQILGN